MRKITWQEKLTEIIRDCKPEEGLDRAQFFLALAKVRLPLPEKKTKAKTRAGKAAAAVAV